MMTPQRYDYASRMQKKSLFFFSFQSESIKGEGQSTHYLLRAQKTAEIIIRWKVLLQQVSAVIRNCAIAKKELRFDGLACRTNRGYPSYAELKCRKTMIIEQRLFLSEPCEVRRLSIPYGLSMWRK